jgi:hypothetical protein
MIKLTYLFTVNLNINYLDHFSIDLKAFKSNIFHHKKTLMFS